MNIGDYVRTENGLFTKIKAICEQKWKEPECVYARVLCEDNEIYEYPKHIKSSPNIIDLIEVGDYVNGHRIIDIAKDQIRALYSEDINQKYALIPMINKDIKSIVTKEMFSQMEYKVGE